MRLKMIQWDASGSRRRWWIGWPWLRARGNNPKRVIAALEMLATLMAIKLWLPEGGSHLQVHTEAFTDNEGIEFILKKAKYPITLLVLEVSETLRTRGATADL